MVYKETPILIPTNVKVRELTGEYCFCCGWQFFTTCCKAEMNDEFCCTRCLVVSQIDNDILFTTKVKPCQNLL